MDHLPLNDASMMLLLKEAAVAAVILNENGEIIFWNYGASEIFGYREIEIIGKPVINLIPQRYHYAHTYAIKRFIEQSKGTENRIVTTKTFGKEEEIYGLRKNGQEFPCEIITVCYSEGIRKAFAAFVYDLSHGILSLLRSVSNKLQNIDQRLNTLEEKIIGG